MTPHNIESSVVVVMVVTVMLNIGRMTVVTSIVVSVVAVVITRLLFTLSCIFSLFLLF